jgi:hypothetical protein
MVDVKRANELHWAVKGHLIPKQNDLDEIEKIYDSYLKRMWGNHEYCYRLTGFEVAWSDRLEEDAKEIAKVARLGYD